MAPAAAGAALGALDALASEPDRPKRLHDKAARLAAALGRLGELDKGREIIVFCAAGVRAHTAAQMLRNNGFSHVKVYPGGAYFYEATHKG